MFTVYIAKTRWFKNSAHVDRKKADERARELSEIHHCEVRVKSSEELVSRFYQGARS